jgi:protein tyrosine phosphatase (PTP) superfamily phosphohydrolase (DUF442 family)
MSSGQPSNAQLAAVAAAGVKVVVNLGLHENLRYALPDEPGHVRGLGMTYVHIPVVFGHPTKPGLLRFMKAMDENSGRSMLLHCAANIRASAFLGLYRVIRLGWQRDPAFDVMRSVWVSDAVWTAFIDDMIVRHAVAGARLA